MNLNCILCGTDVYVDDYDEAADAAWCTGPGHPEPRFYEPKAEAKLAKEKARLDPLRYGIAYELGLYDDLPDLLNLGEWADTVVVEYRYGTAYPDQYAEMIRRWGHVAQSPRRYSVTAFIGSTLGHLSRATNVTHRSGPGTGFFSYNSSIGYWTLEPIPETTTTMSWERCAAEAGIDADTWPLA